MPRTIRASAGGYCYHVLNRGNGRAQVFHHEGDYAAFLGLLAKAGLRVPMRLIGYCLMPNHFHLIVWPRADGDLSRWMHWLMTAHVRRYLKCYRSSGHIWQGRFKAFPIQEDDHLRTVLRYVERNPLRAQLVKRAETWPGRRTHHRSTPGQRREERFGVSSVFPSFANVWLIDIGDSAISSAISRAPWSTRRISIPPSTCR